MLPIINCVLQRRISDSIYCGVSNKKRFNAIHQAIRGAVLRLVRLFLEETYIVLRISVNSTIRTDSSEKDFRS